MKALVSPNLIHGAIEAAFNGEKMRRLWRIDELNGHNYILIVSEEKPQMEHMVKQFGNRSAEVQWETKDYSQFLERVKNDTVWHFRLTANPTRACKDEKEKRGKVRAHITPYHQKKWLLERSEKNGFHVKEEEIDVVKSYWQRFYKGQERKRPVTILSVTYEGLLTVTDIEKFRQTLTGGIGRGKAFGMGMLTIVRAGDTNNG